MSAPTAAGGGASKKIIVILAAVIGVGAIGAGGYFGYNKWIAGGSDENATDGEGQGIAMADDWSTAESSVKTVFNGLADSRPEIIWEAMPAGHKAALNGEVKKAIGNVDADIVNKVREVVQKASAIANDKQNELGEAIMLVGAGMESGSIPPAGTQLPQEPEMDQYIGYAAEVLKFLSESKLLDANWLSNPDIGTFIKDDIGKVLKHPEINKLFDQEVAEWSVPNVNSFSQALSTFRNVKVTVVNSMEDRAILRLDVSGVAIPQGAEPTSAVFVKVEDRWVPEEIADISPLIQSPDLNQFTGMSQMSPGQKSVLIKFLTSLAGVLDAIAKQDTGRKMAEAALPGFAALTPQIETLQRAFPQLGGGVGGPGFPGVGGPTETLPPVLPGLPGAPKLPQGKTIRWTINGGKANSRVDTIYMNKPQSNVMAMFGNPDSVEQGFWIYKGVRVVNITGGGIHNTLLFRIVDGKVVQVASQNR
tara:strand:+ start:423 stop:1850 length:1428 start_codon:yes stop_codon:yes gene_type:complete